jgi:DNA-directed RNA polymerase I, II, and III subunit RPABC2
MSLVTVSPEEIVFPNVLNQEAVFILKVSNVSSSPVAFKVKTTAPKNYLVKPSAGAIPANGSIDIRITLNKQTTDPSANNDRFLVQAVKAPNGKELTKEEWSAVDKSAIQELRLHVVFTNQPGTGAGSAAAVGSSGPSPATVPLDKSASPDQVRAKYDELVSYSKRLESELESTKSQLKKKSALSAVGGSSGFSTLQLVIAMLLAVIVARVATIMGY